MPPRHVFPHPLRRQRHQYSQRNETEQRQNEEKPKRAEIAAVIIEPDVTPCKVAGIETQRPVERPGVYQHQDKAGPLLKEGNTQDGQRIERKKHDCDDDPALEEIKTCRKVVQPVPEYARVVVEKPALTYARPRGPHAERQDNQQDIQILDAEQLAPGAGEDKWCEPVDR